MKQQLIKEHIIFCLKFVMLLFLGTSIVIGYIGLFKLLIVHILTPLFPLYGAHIGAVLCFFSFFFILLFCALYPSKEYREGIQRTIDNNTKKYKLGLTDENGNHIEPTEFLKRKNRS